MNMDRDLVALPGPPFVKARADSNILTVPVKLKIIQVIVMGFKRGESTLRNKLMALQPSIFAASIISPGISNNAP